MKSGIKLFGSSNALLTVLAIIAMLTVAMPLNAAVTIFEEDFESPAPEWEIDNDVWEIGEPVSGPDSAFSGENCAATVLDGNYPYGPDSRLISPLVILPEASLTEEILFQYWQWYIYANNDAYGSTDKGDIQIQVLEDEVWTAWETIRTSARDVGNAWSFASIDLTSYAGKTVRLAFYHQDGTEDPNGSIHHYENVGWYIDDIAIIKQERPQARIPEDFETDWGGWSAVSGIWGRGKPAAGPKSGHNSDNCVGTILNGNYGYRADSRLISSQMVLPYVDSNETLLLRFWHWFSYASTDYGTVQISEWLGDSWGEWKNLFNTGAGSSDGWSHVYIDLMKYTGKLVRIAFYHQDRTEDNSGSIHHYESTGWYIDDIELSHYTAKTIPISEAHNNTFEHDNDRHYYVIEVPPGGHLRFILDDHDDTGINEVYLRHGALPSLGEYDYRFTNTGEADQEIFIPGATPGPWYILIYSDSVGKNGDYTIQAEFSTGIIVNRITADSVGNAGPATITIEGGGFDPSTQVLLVQGETTIPVDAVTYISTTKLFVDIDLTGVEPGPYYICVRSGENSDERQFEVTDGGSPNFVAKLIVPKRIGYHTVATIWVEYANIGEVAMPAPLLIVTATQEMYGVPVNSAIMKNSPTMIPRGFWTNSMPEGFSSTIQILASGETPGIIQPGESFKIPIQYAGWRKPWNFAYPPINFKLGVLEANNETPVNWDLLKEEMRPESIAEDLWEPLWANFITQAGTTWGDYVRMLTDNAVYLSKLGLHVTDIGELLAFEFAQADSLNVLRTIASSTDAYIKSPGLDLSFRRFFGQSISSRYQSGSFGRGWSHNWNITLSVSSDGTVTIYEPGGSRRIFQPDNRPGRGYFSMDGDFAELTDNGGGVFTLQEPDGMLRVFRSDGKPDYIQDTSGNRITTGYTNDLLTGIVHSSGQFLQIEYNDADLVESITDPDGRKTTFTYDDDNEHLISVRYFDDAIVNYVYSIANDVTKEHALTEIEFPGGSHRYLDYDVRGRIDEISVDDGAEAISFIYDNAGMIGITDAFGNTVKYFVDNHGLLVKAIDPQGDAIQLVYDGDYNISSTTDPAGHSYVYEYNSQGQMIHSTDPLGKGTRFSYAGPFNRLTKIVDAKGNITDYGYNDNGDLTSIAYDDTSLETWNYDDAGNPVSWQNRRGNQIAYDYDTAGRITARIYPDESRIDYVYDERGNLVSATDSTGITTLLYDADDRLDRISFPGGRFLQYTYNAAGQRASSENQLGHKLNYHYDTAVRLERITDESSAEIVHYHYDAAGRLERKVLGNGVYTKYEHDEAWQLTSLINYKPDDTILSQFIYTYDSRGRRISMTTLEGRWDYAYDDTGQLTAWTAPDGRHVQYQYDALGNRITVTDNGTATDYITNNMNQYTQVGDTTYRYDADGNMTRKITPEGTTTYTYNLENRLVAVSSPEGNWSYTYDAFGDRVRVDDNGTVTDFVIDPIGFGDVVSEYDNGTGDLKAVYDHGFGLLDRRDHTGNPAFYSFDAIGSTSELTDNTGGTLNAYQYLPFGELRSVVEAIDNSSEFVGEYGVLSESTRINYMRARFYNSKTGHFISVDPIGLYSGDINAYKYSFNLPNYYIDPLGLGVINEKEYCNRKSKYYNPTYCDLINMDQNETSLKKQLKKDPLLNRIQWAETWLVPFTNYPPNLPMPMLPTPVGLIRSLLGDALDYLHDAGGDILNPVPPITNGQEQNVSPVRPRDPNDKIGPGGYGDQNLISNDTLFPYRVNFENDKTATAPAQVVTITDPINEDLDWSTFELTEIGFGDVRISIPHSTQHFETTVPMSFNGVDFEVQVEAGIHLSTGEVYANFYSLDPLSGLPPFVDTGFLPPEDGSGRGQGYFTYVIKAKEGLSAGTEIRNVALITFDSQETIATNQVDPHDPSQGTDPNKECLNTIAPDEVNLITTSTEGGSVTNPGEGTVTCDWGEVINLTATPDENCAFVNWTGDMDTIADVYAVETTVTMYGNFSITANFATGISVYLKQGFNLISIPADVTSMPDLRDWLPVLGDSLEIEKVMVYDDEAGKFITLVPGETSNPGFMLQGGEGLIVYAKQNKEITFGSILCSTHDLKPGFNLVGFSCPVYGYSAYQLLNELGNGNVSSIQRYSTSTGAFETAGFGPDGQLAGVDFSIVAGEGYFIYMK